MERKFAMSRRCAISAAAFAMAFSGCMLCAADNKETPAQTAIQLRLAGDVKCDVAIVPSSCDLASGTRSIWSLGGVSYGRSKPDLLIGHPNDQTRGDRALLRLPIDSLIAAGKVKRAVLHFSLSPRHGRMPLGRSEERRIEMEHFTEDCPSLNLLDLHRGAVEPAASFTVSRLEPGSMEPAFDITAIVNADLRKGFSAVTLRMKDPAAERDGNPDNRATGIAICAETVRLEIEK